VLVLGHVAVGRRTRVVRIFPNEASLIRLMTALAVERNQQGSERLVERGRSGLSRGGAGPAQGLAITASEEDLHIF